MDYDFLPILYSVARWIVVALLAGTSFILAGYIAKAVIYPFSGFVSDGRRYAFVMAARLIALYIAIDLSISIMSIEGGTALVLIAAAAAAVISLSSQSMIGNVIAGIVIQTRGIIRKGDFVALQGMRGKVQDWDLYSLHLLTVDNSNVFMSWSVVADSIIENESTDPYTPIEVIIPIPGDVDVKDIYTILQKCALEQQLKIWKELSEDGVDGMREYAHISGVSYPYVVFREVGGDAVFFHMYILADDQDDRRLDMIHSYAMIEAFDALTRAGYTPGQTSDQSNKLSGKVEVIMAGDKNVQLQQENFKSEDDSKGVREEDNLRWSRSGRA